MPITSSGQIALIADIEAEFDQIGTDDISLFQARTDAGLSDGEVAFTDFYGLSDAVAPSVTTNSNTSIGTSSITANGNVTSDGGATVTSRGFYFGTSSNYASNSKYTVGSGTGSFSNNFTGLSSSTTHYATAFAINSAGESVGSTVSSATTQPSISGSITMSFSGLPTSVSTYATVNSNFNQYFVNSSGTNVTLSAGGRSNVTLKIVNWRTPFTGTRNLPQTFANGYDNDYGRITIGSSGSSGSIYLVASASGYASHSYLIGT